MLRSCYEKPQMGSSKPVGYDYLLDNQPGTVSWDSAEWIGAFPVSWYPDCWKSGLVKIIYTYSFAEISKQVSSNLYWKRLYQTILSRTVSYHSFCLHIKIIYYWQGELCISYKDIKLIICIAYSKSIFYLNVVIWN